jgi:hypothetical protein
MLVKYWSNTGQITAAVVVVERAWAAGGVNLARPLPSIVLTSI